MNRDDAKIGKNHDVGVHYNIIAYIATYEN